MKLHDTKILLAAGRAALRDVRCRSVVVTAAALLMVAPLAMAQEASPPPTCEMSASFDSAPDLTTFSNHSWHFTVSCSGTVIRFYSGSVGVTITGPNGFRDQFTGGVSLDSQTTSSPEPQSVSGTGDIQAIRMSCLQPGTYTFTTGVLVDYIGFLPYDPVTSCHGNCPLQVGARGNGGSFTIAAADSAVTLSAELPQPPVGANNVRLKYKFGANSRDPRWQIDNNAPSRLGNFAGELLLKLAPGHHTFAAYSCGLLAATAEIDVPATEQPGVFTFDLPSTENVKVLIHRYGDQTLPAPLNDSYPSPLQSADRAIKVQGTVKDASGRPLSGKTVYFRLTDPPDQAPYVPVADRASDDNKDGPGTLSAGSAVSDSAGRVSVILTVTDHVSGDNYQLEASTKPDFSCDLAVARRARRTPLGSASTSKSRRCSGAAASYDSRWRRAPPRFP